MTSYDIIYDRFSSHITDYDFVNMPEEDLEEMLHGYLISAITRFKRCSVDLSDRDDQNKTFNVDLSDSEIEVLALFMVCAWLEPRIKSCLLTNMLIGGKEEKYYSQSQHLQTLMALRESSLTEAKKLIRDESYIENTYFD